MTFKFFFWKKSPPGCLAAENDHKGGLYMVLLPLAVGTMWYYQNPSLESFVASLYSEMG